MSKHEMSTETRAYLRELRESKRWPARRAKILAAAEAEAKSWNDAHEIGTSVNLTRDDGSIFTTKTRTPAWALSSGDAVVSVVGISGGYLLSRVKAITP